MRSVRKLNMLLIEKLEAAETDAYPPVTPVSRTKLEPLAVRILCADVAKHLDGIRRQRGGLGRQGFDEKQKDLRAFFGGGGAE